MEFWKDFALIMILREFKKLEDMNDNMKINIGKNKNIPENFKIKIGEVLFSQLLPYVGNMSEFNLEKKYIMKIIDDIKNRYNYLDNSNLETIYELICKSKEEINELKEQIKNDKELVGSTINEAIIKKKCKREDDEDKKQLLEYIQDVRTHELFLIVLSKLRTNNRFCREKPLIELLSEILLIILDNAQKKKDYNSAKNCIILSQTFYYNDKSKECNKVYILEYIKSMYG